MTMSKKFRKLFMAIALLIYILMPMAVMAEEAQAPAGQHAAAAPAAPAPAATPAPPPKIDTGDTAWVLVSTALVMLMTPGLALFYGGVGGKKKVLGTIMQSFIIVAIINIQWVLWGYTLAFGPDKGGIIGGLEWLGLNGVGLDPNPDYAATIPHQAFMIFQMMFAVITPALITGAFAERMKFSTFFVFTILWATLVYDPICHWVWAVGGWIRNFGALDFAGGTVVHISSGVSALAAALVIGKRKGYMTEIMAPHNLPMTVLGAASGAVAGLVAITPASGFVGPMSSIVIGFGGGILCYMAVSLIKPLLGYDDSLDAFGVHGVGGTWGALATGLFATTAINSAGADGLFFGNPALLGKQIVAVLATMIYAFVVTLILLKVLDWVMGLRVSQEEETEGLDLTQHGESGYSS